MAGIAQFLNHGFELAGIPSSRFLHFFQRFSFFSESRDRMMPMFSLLEGSLLNFSNQYLSKSTFPTQATTFIIDSQILIWAKNFLTFSLESPFPQEDINDEHNTTITIARVCLILN
jgi:hypothetical protein